MLLFRTPPYIINEIILQDNQFSRKAPKKNCDSPRIVTLEREMSVEKDTNSDVSNVTQKANRRFSSTSIK